MTTLDLQAGDICCTRNPMSLGRVINAAQVITSRDGKSIYSHSLIITNKYGKTLESLWTVKNQNLYEAYRSTQVIIARWKGMTPDIAEQAIKIIEEEHLGKWYPMYRLPFQIIPTFAKYISFKGKFLVCSELAAKFLWVCHILTGAGTKDYPEPRHKWYTGTSPDTLADEFHRWTGCYEIGYEGML